MGQQGTLSGEAYLNFVYHFLFRTCLQTNVLQHFDVVNNTNFCCYATLDDSANQNGRLNAAACLRNYHNSILTTTVNWKLTHRKKLGLNLLRALANAINFNLI